MSIFGRGAKGAPGEQRYGQVYEYRVKAENIIRTDPDLNPHKFQTDPEGFGNAVWAKLSEKAQSEGKPIDPNMEAEIKNEIEDIRGLAVVGWDA
jgi:hypothetical protein